MDARSFEQTVVIIGGGPAALMAAEHLSCNNISVTIIDSQKRVGKKFLVAGDGGLNLTHSEPLQQFINRYTDADWAKEMLTQFTPDAFVNWLKQLGINTFTGSSGRIFPAKTHKPAEVLTAWIEKLKNQGVVFLLNTELTAVDYPSITLKNSTETFQLTPKYLILALGGKSWAKTGSTGKWTEFINHIPLLPSNIGLHTNWSDYFIEKFEGSVLKYVAVTFNSEQRIGDVVLSKTGLESTPIYHHSAAVVRSLQNNKEAIIYLDLKPNSSAEQLLKKVNSTDTWLQCFKKWKLHISQKALYVEVYGKQDCSPSLLAARIKKLPIIIAGYDKFDKAIATQGGVSKEYLTKELAFKAWQNWYVAGEILNQDAPTGGYLIQHAVSSGWVAAKDIINKLTKS
jgi:uncharacterized flavoprotein (TIGR03862 family)